MTTALAHIATVEQARAAADAFVDAELAKHGTDYARLYPPMPTHADGTPDVDAPWAEGEAACLCGFTPGAHVAKRNRTRSLGLHVSRTRAGIADTWGAVYDAKLAELRAEAR